MKIPKIFELPPTSFSHLLQVISQVSGLIFTTGISSKSLKAANGHSPFSQALIVAPHVHQGTSWQMRCEVGFSWSWQTTNVGKFPPTLNDGYWKWTICEFIYSTKKWVISLGTTGDFSGDLPILDVHITNMGPCSYWGRTIRKPFFLHDFLLFAQNRTELCAPCTVNICT